MGQGISEVLTFAVGIDSFSPAKALVLGALLAGVNPKNLPLTLAPPPGSRSSTSPRATPSSH
jgi:hypothetical protein